VITSPNGGEVINYGDIYPITWQSSGDLEFVDIFIGYRYTCEGCPTTTYTETSIFGLPNTGTYNWVVDVDDPTNKEFFVGIQGERFSEGSFIPGPWDVTDNPFLIVLSSVPTRTVTPTNASTPVPACSKLTVIGTLISGTDFNVIVKNENAAPGFLTAADITWPAYPGMTFDHARFGGNTYYNTDQNTSPVITTAPAIQINGGVSISTFRARFKDAVNMTGLFSAELTFNFPGWGDCVLIGSINQNTATPYITFTPESTDTPYYTPTFTPTFVDLDTPTPTANFTVTPTATRTSTPTPTRTITWTPDNPD
jgi:hypothetical protein